MEQHPLATICIPLYNKSEFIAKTLEAVLQQTYPNLEVVVSDNGSTDGSETIAKAYASRDSRIKYYRLHHTVSMNESWRYCYRLAQGEFVKIHGGDDHTLQPNFLEKMVAPLLRRPEVGFTVCEVRPAVTYMFPGITEQALVNCYRGMAAFARELANTPDRDERARKLFVRASLENQVGTPWAVVCRHSSFPLSHWKKTTCYWPESYPDWDFMLRLFLAHRGAFVEEVHLSYHYDVGNWYCRILVDDVTDLQDKVFRFMMPFTIFADPEMADLRRAARPEELALLVQAFQQRMTQVAETSDQVVAFDHPHFTRKALHSLTHLIEAFHRNPADLGVLLRIRKYRTGLARHWLRVKPDLVVSEYAGLPGQAHRMLLESGIRRFQLSDYEQTLVNDSVRRFPPKANSDDGVGALLSLMLLKDLRLIPNFDVALLPEWLRAGHDRFADAA